MRFKTAGLVTLGIVVIVLVVVNVQRRNIPKGPAKTSTQTYSFGVLDGRDDDGALVVERVNLWKQRGNPNAGIAGVANHGDRVRIIERRGSWALVRPLNGRAQGWVSTSLID